MAKKSVTQRLKEELAEKERQIQSLQKANDEAWKRVRDMQDEHEEQFIHSPTRLQMQRDIDFYRNCESMSQMHLESEYGKWYRIRIANEKLQAENEELLKKHKADDTEYFVGICEHAHDQSEYLRLEKEVTTLQGKLDGAKHIIKSRDGQIKLLNQIIAELRMSQEDDSHITDCERIEYEQALEYVAHDKLETARKLHQLQEKYDKLKGEYIRPIDTRYSTVEEQLERANRELERWRMDWIFEPSSYSRSDLVKEIRELKEQLRKTNVYWNNTKKKLHEVRCKRYDQYVQADHLTYLQMEQELADLREELKEEKEWGERIRNIRYSDYHSDAYRPTREEKLTTVEENIVKAREIKKSTAKKQGRPDKYDSKIRALVIELKLKKYSIRDIQTQTGMSVGTIHNIWKKYQEQQNNNE